MLSLESTLVSCRAVEDLASSKYVKSLVKLNLCHCIKVGDNGMKILFNSENFRSIKKLNIGYTHLTDASLAALAASKQAISIESLNFMRMGKVTKELFAMFSTSKSIGKSVQKIKFRRIPLTALCNKSVFYFNKRIFFLRRGSPII